MSLLNISNSTKLLNLTNKIIFPKCINLNNTINSNPSLKLNLKNLSSTPLNKASTFDYSKHSNDNKTFLGYNKVAHLKKNSKEINNSIEYVKKSWNQYLASEGFDSNFKTLKIIEEESNHPGRVVMKFTVQKEHTNRHGGLHGGFISSLIDIVGSLSVSSYGDKYSNHVSADINVSFMRGAKVGDEVIVEAKCEKLGRSLAFTVVELYNEKTKNIIAEGRHTKFIKMK